MPRSRRSSTDSSDYGAPIRITTTQVRPAPHSHSGHHRRHSPDVYSHATANTYLQLPNQRPRASSTSGQPAPIINNFYEERPRSRSRSRYHHDSSSGSSRHSHSRHRRYSGQTVEELAERRIYEKDKADRQREEDIKEAIARAKVKDEEKKKERDRIYEEKKLEKKLEKEREEEHEKEILARVALKAQEKKDKEKKEKEEFDEKYEEKVKRDFLAAGYSEAIIERIIKQKKDKERNTLAIDARRPTFIRVHEKYLSTRTLEHFGLPWDYDDQNPEFIIIKQYVPHELQDELFEHTKALKNRKLITDGGRGRTGLGVSELVVDGGDLFVVKKKRGKSKSPARPRGFFIR